MGVHRSIARALSFRVRLIIVSGLALAAAGAAQARGASLFDWVASGGGSFDDRVNWSPRGGPPDALDTARFFTDSPRATISTVTFPSSVSNDRLEFNASSWIFDLGGNTYSVTGGFPCATFGGELTLIDGTLDTQWSGVSGSLTLEQSTTVWQNAVAVYLDAASQLNLLSGAQLFTTWTDIAAAPGSSGTLTVSDVGSLLSCPGSVMGVGSHGAGSLLVDQGAVVNSLWGEIGTQAGAVGNATVRNGSEWNMPDSITLVGIAGEGHLTIEGAASVTSGWLASIGDGAGSTGDVLLNGLSHWTIGGNLQIGNGGSGELRLLTIPTQGAAMGHPVVDVGAVFLVGAAAGGTGELTISGPGAMLHVGSFGVVGASGEGHVTLQLGGELQLDGPLLLGEQPGGDGEIFLNGAFAFPAAPELNVTGYMSVGEAGTGSINMILQGHITGEACIIGAQPGSTGSINLSIGPGPDLTLSSYLDVGQGGHGTFTLSQTSATATQLFAGVIPGSLGEVILDAGATFTTTDGAIVAGLGGTGGFHASGGALVTVLGGVDQIGGLVGAGFEAGSSGEIHLSGANTLVDATSQLVCGSFGSGSLLIETGAELRTRKSVSASNSAGIIGLNDGGTGDAIVQSGGLLNCVDGFLVVGFRDGSEGSLTISGGGDATSVGGFIGREAGSMGEVVVTGAGSAWTSSATLTIGDLGTGSLNVSDDGVVSAPQIINGANGTVTGDGMLDGNVINSGVIAPGNSAGALTIDGNYTQSATGRLVLEVGGTGPGQFDVLQGTFGFFNLGGTLEIQLIDGFVPRGGEQILILGGAGMLNSFETLVGPVPFEVTPGETIVLLTFLEPCVPADINCDGMVDGADLGLLLSQWGTDDEAADLDGNGVVDGGDMGLMLAAWG